MTVKNYVKLGSVTDKVTEEIGELLQAISKANRFGWLNRYPDDNHANVEAILHEMKDLRLALTDLQEYIGGFWDTDPVPRKREKVPSGFGDRPDASRYEYLSQRDSDVYDKYKDVDTDEAREICKLLEDKADGSRAAHKACPR